MIQGATTGILALIGVWLGAWLAFRLGRRTWRLTHCTEEWYKLVDFLAKNAQFMEPEKTRCYVQSFQGSDAVKYEMIARRCIAFLDDMYYLGYQKELDEWYRGSIALFAGRHETWLKDNKASYDGKFYKFIEARLRPAAVETKKPQQEAK